MEVYGASNFTIINIKIKIFTIINIKINIVVISNIMEIQKHDTQGYKKCTVYRSVYLHILYTHLGIG